MNKPKNPALKKIEEKAAMGKMKLLNFEVEEKDIRKLKAKAALEGVKMSHIIRKLIKDYI